MDLRPKEKLTEGEVQTGLRLVIYDGLTTEAMTALTGGTFLVAIALLIGASNFQIGLLAALPTLTNIFQLLSIWLVRHYNNRRGVSVICSTLARLPLIAAAAVIFFFPSVNLLLFFLFFYYFFSSISGPSWNSWMKDLVPEKTLGSFFSRRGSYSQTLNVIISLTLALVIDYIKDRHPEYELSTYALMFAVGGFIGLVGTYILSRTPEPRSERIKENIFLLLKRPLQDKNFRRLLAFNSIWIFAINLATPFFIVFLLQGMHLALSYIIGLTVISQLCSIFTIRIWGRFADRYSNKTIIGICAPLYILCIIGWCFVGIYSDLLRNMILLVTIYIFTGISTAGINLSLTNIGLKLAPKDQAIVYLSAKNIVTSFFSSVAPLIGGLLADYFLHRRLDITIQWNGPHLNKIFRLLQLHEWNFLFAIGAILAFISLEFLVRVKEEGEVEKDVVVRIMRSSIKNNLKEAFVIGQLISWPEQIWGFIRRKKIREKHDPSTPQTKRE